MKIYIAHSSSFDYVNRLYRPIKKFNINNQHEIIFPHDSNSKGNYSKNMIEACDLVIAEASYPSTGMGIELGWAHSAKIPILCLYEKGKKLSSSLTHIANDFVEYTDAEDLIASLGSSVSVPS